MKKHNEVVLVTGVAGFIGFHLAISLLADGYCVVGIDNINDYYDVRLKEDRLNLIFENSKTYSTDFFFHRINLEDLASLTSVFESHKPSIVYNLAAQAGVRYSLTNPHAYVGANIVSFVNLLECCRHFSVQHLLYASSSSVYGGNVLMPFSESHNVDHPVSLYAATKKSNELMAHTYSHLFGLPSTGLRFFTVYGPWGRPDMALFLFTKAILEGEPIEVFNNGEMTRDFTYIDDIIFSLKKLMTIPPTPNASFDRFTPNPSSSWAPYRVLNIGNSSPERLLDYISAIESALGIKAKMTLLPMQPGDVQATSANTDALSNLINFKPSTSIQDGVASFVNWFKAYYSY